MYGPLAAFLLGLAGSLHCVGMCGPIAIALPGDGRSTTAATARFALNPHDALLRMLYQLGRVSVYTTMGLVIGLGGSAFRIAGYSRTLSLVAGLLMIVSVAAQYLFRRDWSPLSLLGRSVGPLQAWLGSLLRRRGTLAHYLIGVANGLLPCGLVTTALLGALASGSLVSGGLYMAAFGLGTVPLMSAVTLGVLALPCSWRKRLPMVAPVTGLILGLLILVRGMGLGIPYVSPAPMTAVHHTCCSK